MTPKLPKLSKIKSVNPGDIKLPNVKLYHKAVVTESACQWYNNVHIVRKKTANLDISPLHSHSRLLLDKDAKKVHCKEDSLFSKCCCENGISIYRLRK